MHGRVIGVAAALALTSGCVVIREPSSPVAPSPYANESQQLADAEAALAAERYDDAARLSHEARAALKGSHADGSDRAIGANQVLKKLLAHAIAIEGTARKRKGDAIGAVLVLGADPFEEKDCAERLRALCHEHHVFVYEEPAWKYLRAHQNSQYNWEFSDHLISFSDFTFGLMSLTTAELGALPNHMTNDADYLAVWVTHSASSTMKSTKEKDQERYVLTGTPMSVGSTECGNKIGEVQIGDTRYDVKRCQHSTMNFTPASLTFSLPLDEAELVPFNEGDRVLVAFRKKNFHRVGGNAWTLGPARLARGGKK